jgi:hypothetical protein
MMPVVKPNLKVERVLISAVKTHPRNARRGNVDVIAESLETHGQYRPLVVQRSTNFVLAGNHTLKAAKQLGWSHVEVTYLDVDKETALRILLVDNKSSDMAEYDDDALANMLGELNKTSSALLATGFNDDDYAALTASLVFDVPNFQPDESEQPRLDQREAICCPECSYSWRVGARGEVIPA